MRNFLPPNLPWRKTQNIIPKKIKKKQNTKENEVTEICDNNDWPTNHDDNAKDTNADNGVCKWIDTSEEVEGNNNPKK